MIAASRRRFAQPRWASLLAADGLSGIWFGPGANTHVHESHEKTHVGEKIAKPSAGPIPRAPAGLARRYSTSLSTAIVDKKKSAKASPTYRVFLCDATASGCK